MKQTDEIPEEMEFEQQLKHALRRVDAPDGFADKVMAQAGLREKAARPAIVKLRSWYALAALLLVSLLSFAGYQRIEQQRLTHERQVRAEQQFDLALEITDSALDQTRQQLRQAGIPLEP